MTKGFSSHLHEAVDSLGRWPYWWLLGLALALAATVMGFIGFRQVTASNMDAAFDTIDLFSLRWPSPPETPLILQIARVLAPLATAGVLLKAVLTLYDARIERVRASRARDHVVVCGLGVRGARLVESLRAAGHRVVGVDASAGAPGVASSRALGALVVVGDAGSPAILRQAGIARASEVLIVGGDDETNLEIAAAAGSLLRRDQVRDATIQVQLSDAELCRALNERAARATQLGAPHVEFINQLERGATAMLRRYPLPDSTAPGKARGVLIVGQSAFGEALTVVGARLWSLQANRSGRLRIWLADPGANEWVSRLGRRHEPLARWADLEAVEARVGTPELESDLSARGPEVAGSIGRAYVCLDNDADALTAGLRVQRWLGDRPVPVVVKVRSSRGSAGRFVARDAAAGASAGGLYLFGLIEETCTAELLLQHRVEVLARALHERYLEQQLRAGQSIGEKPTLVPWDELDSAGRRASRDHAREMGAALETAGFSVFQLDSWDAEPLVLDDDEVERLARDEHRRWMQAKFRDGFRLGPRDDAVRHHPDLVPWEALSEASRDIDRDLVRSWPELLASAGFGVRRAGASGAEVDGGTPSQTPS